MTSRWRFCPARRSVWWPERDGQVHAVEDDGLEQPSNGEAALAPGASVGVLLQEPPLDEDETVLRNVQHGVAETLATLHRYNEISAQLAVDYSEELLDEMGRLQEQLDQRDAWDLDSQLE